MADQVPASANPYVGPRTFTRADRARFFGREREARELLSLVISQRLALFYAQSGAGKSSLINTRLAPQLAEEGYVVLPIARVGGDPPPGVSAVDNIFLFNLMLSLDQSGRDPNRLAHVNLTSFLARLTSDDGERFTYVEALEASASSATGGTPVSPLAGGGEYTEPNCVLIIDQFEEIFSSHPGRWEDRGAFFMQLDAAMRADRRLWVVLALREDYVAALDPYAPLLTDKLRGRFYMERMGLEAALEAIRRPAELAGRPFVAGVAETLRDDLCQVRVPGREEPVSGQYVEPVQLQVVCYQLWENVKDRPLGPITAADLRDAGDVNRALIQFYEDTLAAVLAEKTPAVSERQLRLWFDRELITEEGTRGLVRQGEESTGSLPTPIVGRLQKRFMVRAEARSGDVWIELVHDRFVEPIRASNRTWFARNLNPLTLAAQAWREAGREPGRLYGGSQLAAAAAQLQNHPEEFGELEQEFVEAGQKAEAGRAARRQRNMTWGAMVLAALFIALAGLAMWKWRDAEVSGAVSVAARGTAEAAMVEALVARETAEADRVRAVKAEQEAIELAWEAQAASEAAGFQAGRERIARREAEESAATAVAAKATAEVAGARAIAGEATARAAIAAQSTALADQSAALQTSLTAQAMAALPPPTPTATPQTTPTGTPTPGAVGSGTPRPVGTSTPSRTVPPPPTVNLTVIAQQTQLAQVRATQTALAVAPPTGRIIFVSNRASTGEDLYVMKPDGTQQERWIFNAREPSYTRGTGLLAMTKKQDSPWQLSIYVMPIGGGPEQRVTKPEDWDYWEPSIAPDGKRIAAASSHVNVLSEILIIDLSGNVIGQVTNQNPARSWRPSWSPDGLRIAYASERSSTRGEAEIWVKDLSTSQDRNLTRNGAYNSDPAWSPDSLWIAFISDRDGNRDVWVMDANGDNQRNLTRSREDERYPVWSPDGSWLAFTRFMPDQEIFVMRADGTQAQNLTQNPMVEEFQPVWVP